MDRSNVTLTIRLISRIASLAILGALTACGSSKPEPAPLESLDSKAASPRVSIAWSVRVGDVSPTASFAVSDGRLAVASNDGDLVALEVASGREAWRTRVKGKVSAAAGFDGRYAAIVTDANELQVFDQGKLLWQERQPGRVVTAPVIAGERVFLQAVDRSIRAYDVLDGRWLWSYQRPGSEPLALDGRLLIQPVRDTLIVGQGNRLIGLDPLKGTPKFDLNVGTPRGSNEVERLADLIGPLARVGGDACVRAFQFSVACLDLSRGAVRWSRPQTGTQAVSADTSMVVAADSADRLTAWKTDGGDFLWRVDRFTHRGFGAPLIVGDRIVVGDSDGYVHILAKADGRTLGRIELDSSVVAQPVVSGDLLLVITRKGTVSALRIN
jgi:outer membrane protein assembly factor BamB